MENPEQLLQRNALQMNLIFCFWTGENDMSQQRQLALSSIFRTTKCPIKFLGPSDVQNWQHPDQPFHPAYKYLSETHKSDYLRCYFMHHFGGGYTDIKATTADWRDAFRSLSYSDALALGYQEIDRDAVAPVGGIIEIKLHEHYKDLIGNCAYIFKPRTKLTSLWLYRTHEFLDKKLRDLCLHPAKHPRDQLGATYADGTESAYPIGWTELLGNIFHPIIYEFRHAILQAPISPSFKNYR